MSIMPQDITGAITVVWFLAWMESLDWVFDNIAVHCEAPILAFFLYGSIDTALMLGVRYFLRWIWA